MNRIWGDNPNEKQMEEPDPDCGPVLAPGECSYELESPLGETSGDLDALQVGKTIFTADDLSALTVIESRQIGAAMTKLGFLPEGEDFDAVFDAADEGRIDRINLEQDGAAYDWIKLYAGDTEVGVVFNDGSLTIVAEIGDGDILGCTSN